MLTFNEQGLLTPADGISATIDELYDIFVVPFPESETRSRLFADWTKYNRMLRQELDKDFTQWVDGSFVTQKLNPKDIDIVSFIPSYLFRKFEKRLDYYWTDNWEKEGVDAYLVEQYMDRHSRFSEFEATLENWRRLYTSTKAKDNFAGANKGFLIVRVE